MRLHDPLGVRPIRGFERGWVLEPCVVQQGSVSGVTLVHKMPKELPQVARGEKREREKTKFYAIAPFPKTPLYWSRRYAERIWGEIFILVRRI